MCVCVFVYYYYFICQSPCVSQGVLIWLFLPFFGMLPEDERNKIWERLNFSVFFFVLPITYTENVPIQCSCTRWWKERENRSLTTSFVSLMLCNSSLFSYKGTEMPDGCCVGSSVWFASSAYVNVWTQRFLQRRQIFLSMLVLCQCCCCWNFFCLCVCMCVKLFPHILCEEQTYIEQYQ